MTKVLKARKRIKHDGEFYEPGDLIEGVEQFHAQRLVNLNAATFVGESVSVDDEDDLKKPGEENNQNDGDSDDNDGDDLGGLPGIDDLTDEEVIKLIDEHFKLELLKEEAASIGMEFAGNISKSKLIQQILNEEKEQYFLDQIPE